jgi:hypothetical protein
MKKTLLASLAVLCSLAAIYCGNHGGHVTTSRTDGFD